jgi:phosphoglycolate phosphatase
MLHIIWDLDGTLIDSQNEIIYTIELALRDVGLNISEAINAIEVGPPLNVMLKQAFPSSLLTEYKLAEVIMHFRKRYDNSDFKMTLPFKGIEKIISDKKSFIHHIVTNKPYYATKRIIEKVGWSNQFATIISSDVQLTNPDIKANRNKSKTEFFSDLILQYGDISLFIGIGDTKSDCIAAKNNNIRSIGVLWGTGTREEMSEYCDYLFYDTEKLCEYLYKLRDTKRQ